MLGFSLWGCTTAKPVEEAPVVEDAPPPICALESPELCLQDGVDLWFGNGRPVDRIAARQKFELACAGGLATGCTYLGIALTQAGDDLDHARAFDLFETSCNGGEPMACTQLGGEYLGRAWMKSSETGEPQTAAFVAANEYLRRACETDDTDEVLALWRISPQAYACSNLASSYEHGNGVPKDQLRAFELYEFSCSKKFTHACAQMAFFLDEGLGVDADPARALEIYEQNCELRDAMSCHNLATKVRAEDPERAAELYGVACESGMRAACDNRDLLAKPAE